MNKEQAIEVLIKAAEAANKSGAFTLQDAAYVANAIAIIKQPVNDTALSKPIEQVKE